MSGSKPRPAAGATMRVVPKHHGLVRLSHWVNVPLLLGLIASGLSIYWAAPVFHHPPDPVTGSRDYLRDLGIALRLHWALAYLFMLNGLLYLIGLSAGGGWRALLPRRADVGDALRMMRFYLG